MKALRLFRSFACYHIIGLVGFVAHYFPRSPERARIVNALTRPFFGYGAYWALHRNPSFQAAQREMEANHDHQ